MNKRWTIIFFIFLLLCIVAGGGAWYFYDQMQRNDENAAYQEAIIGRDYDQLQRYLAHYASAPREHRDSVKALLQQLRLDQREREAQEQLNSIDSADYALARQINTLEAYQKYLRLHPNSKHVEEIKDIIIELSSSNATYEDSVFAHLVCRQFFQALNMHDEQKLLSMVPDTLTQLLNHNNATNRDVVKFMNQLYKQDVKNLNFLIQEPLSLTRSADKKGNNIISASFIVTLTLDRTEPAKENKASYNVSADVNTEGRISKLNMKKISTDNN